jgi:hypothetical protein
MPRLSSLLLCLTASSAIAQASQTISVKKDVFVLTYAPVVSFAVRIESLLAADFTAEERWVKATFSCDPVNVSDFRGTSSADLAMWRKRFVQGNALNLGSTRISCQNDRLVIRAGSWAALLPHFPNYDGFSPEEQANLRALNRFPGLILYRNGVEFLGFRFLFAGGKVTADTESGRMSISQGGKLRRVLSGGKLIPAPFNDKRPYTLHTSPEDSKVWSNLRVDPTTGTVTAWSSDTPQP